MTRTDSSSAIIVANFSLLDVILYDRWAYFYTETAAGSTCYLATHNCCCDPPPVTTKWLSITGIIKYGVWPVPLVVEHNYRHRLRSVIIVPQSCLSHLSERSGEIASEVAVVLLPILRLAAADLISDNETPGTRHILAIEPAGACALFRNKKSILTRN